jgi:hypothetical protein
MWYKMLKRLCLQKVDFKAFVLSDDNRQKQTAEISIGKRDSLFV